MARLIGTIHRPAVVIEGLAWAGRWCATGWLAGYNVGVLLYEWDNQHGPTHRHRCLLVDSCIRSSC